MRQVIAVPILVAVFLAAVPAQDVYGPGTPDFNGYTPVLSSNQAWMGNAGFAYNISNALGGATAYFGLSFQSASFNAGGTQINISILPADLLLLAPLPLGGTFGVPGTGSASLPIPLTFAPSNALAGLNFFAQAVVDDPINPLNPLAGTRGLRVPLTVAPRVFVGTSVGGSTDPYRIVDPLAGTVVESAGITSTDNVTLAAYAHGGLDLYVAKSLGNNVTRADFSSGTSNWTNLYTGPGACYGVFHDWKRDRVYTLSGAATTTREIKAVDCVPTSPTYGQAIATTTGLSGGVYLERWALSRSCDLAAVPAIFGPTGNLLLVDTNPAHATYMQVVLTSPIPVNVPSAATFSAAAGFTPDDETVVIALAGLGTQELARYHIPSGTWLDANTGTPQVENVTLPGLPNRMDVSHDGRFALVTSSSSPGFISKVDFAPTFPYAATITNLLSGSGLLASAYGAGISRDDSIISATSLTPPKLLLISSSTGTLLFNVPLTGLSNIYTTAWN